MKQPTEYTVELRKFGDFGFYFKPLRSFTNKEDAEWLARYYWCFKNKECRVVSTSKDQVHTFYENEP